MLLLIEALRTKLSSKKLNDYLTSAQYSLYRFVTWPYTGVVIYKKLSLNHNTEDGSENFLGISEAV